MKNWTRAGRDTSTNVSVTVDDGYLHTLEELNLSLLLMFPIYDINTNSLTNSLLIAYFVTKEWQRTPTAL